MIQTEIAAALRDRGYQTLTAVQDAVLAPEAAGRDLLVSAQTGSGKTVAFGIAAAPEVLDSDGTLPDVSVPLALMIAPTRELALQVAAELTWLYAATGALIATCVGGMDYRSERRALERGAQIVVGTPGRLRDHIERGGLDLSHLRVAVLDEADEMLDLGFREDLEFILQSAPATRRTLMFSATVPAAIEKLARDFQRDALRLAAMGEARQHGDIAYRALSVAVRDRENAIFNLLRFHEARTAIVFCKTRANVNHLLARMNNRGFRAVALSGELSQAERTHALQALRDGRSSVCIATDVAARGIDLPGLELVVHADLPTNPETLLHRSGRTGRAGAKGISALIVTPAEYRKAQRLLQGAGVLAEWGRAPSADEVSARDDARMLDDPALTAPVDDMAAVQALLARVPPEQVASAFIRLWREGRPPPEDLIEIAPSAEAGAAPRPPREFGASVWFALSVGHTGRAEARWLLPKICEAAGITRDAIGAIRVRESETFVQIAVGAAGRLGNTLEVAPDLTMVRLTGDPLADGAPRRPVPQEPARQQVRNAGPDPAPRDRLWTVSSPDAGRATDRHAEPRPRPATKTPKPSNRSGNASVGEVSGGKPRWTKAQKDGRSSASAEDEKAPAPRDKRPHPGKPFGKPPGKPQGKSPDRKAGPRRTTEERDAPRRPRGRS